MSDWLTYLAIPSVAISFAVMVGGLSVSYLAIRAVLAVTAPAKSHLARHFFGYFWMASVLAIVGFLLSEFGYQLDFWNAPGIWGQPGKESTVWGPLQYILPPTGFVLGMVLNARLDHHRSRVKARSVRIGVGIFASVLLVVTLMLSAWHGMQTLG